MQDIIFYVFIIIMIIFGYYTAISLLKLKLYYFGTISFIECLILTFMIVL